MPLWDYRCPTCGDERIDVLIHRADTVVFCNNCRRNMERLRVTSPAIVRIKGFSEANGYSNSDAHPRPSRYPGISTAVKA